MTKTKPHAASRLSSGMHPFARAVADFARREQLFPPGARVLIALSGGPDSCALLLALLEAAEHGALGRPVGVAHFHHGMRGEGADRDAAFAGALSARFGLPCVIGLGNVPAERRGAPAAPGRRSPNDAARQARYAFLVQAARSANADTIATAHTADDQAETVLGRVLRGTGVDGLAGIPAARELHPGLRVVRPLLEQHRPDVEAYCRDWNIAPRRDPSNDDSCYARSRLRAQMPRLARDFNPRLSDALNRLAQSAAVDADLLNALTDALWQRVAQTGPGTVRLDRSLSREHAALRRRMVLRALQEVAGDAPWAEELVTAENVAAIESLLRADTLASADLPGGVRLQRERDRILLSTRVSWDVPAPYRYALPVPGRVWVRPAALTLYAAWASPGSASFMRRGPAIEIACDTMGSKAPEPRKPLRLHVRPARPGDRIAPLGMNGKTRLVRDVMAGAGWSVPDRAAAPLVVRGDSEGKTDEILWIVGLAQAESTRIVPGARRVLRLRAEPDC